MPPKFKNCSRKTNKNKYAVSDCRSRWSKEPQWENDCGSFCTKFSTSAIHISRTITNGEIYRNDVTEHEWVSSCTNGSFEGNHSMQETSFLWNS
jgi:hypothetical protein